MAVDIQVEYVRRGSVPPHLQGGLIFRDEVVTTKMCLYDIKILNDIMTVISIQI